MLLTFDDLTEFMAKLKIRK